MSGSRKVSDHLCGRVHSRGGYLSGPFGAYRERSGIPALVPQPVSNRITDTRVAIDPCRAGVPRRPFFTFDVLPEKSGKTEPSRPSSQE